MTASQSPSAPVTVIPGQTPAAGGQGQDTTGQDTNGQAGSPQLARLPNKSQDTSGGFNLFSIIIGFIAAILGIGSGLGDVGGGLLKMFGFGGDDNSQSSPSPDLHAPPALAQKNPLQHLGDKIVAAVSTAGDTINGFTAEHFGNSTTDQKLKQMRANMKANGIDPDKLQAVIPMDTPNAYISSPFGWRESTQSNHKGIDIVPDNVNEAHPHILAAMPGVVTNSYFDPGGYGNVVYIKGVDGKEYRYAHMANDSVVVKVGQVVSQKDVLGTMGDTGDPQKGAYHLHFEERENGVAVNPSILGRQWAKTDVIHGKDDLAYMKAHDPNPHAAIVAATSLHLPSLGIASDGYIPPTGVSPGRSGASRATS